MVNLSGTFSGRIDSQSAVALPDVPHHDLSLAQISGVQKSSDANWNNTSITYWGVTDVVEGKGTQRGYFVNVHEAGDRDWGSFEGKVTTSGNQVTVEGTWQFTGGSGKFTGLSGGGTFRTRMTSPTEVECSWQGAYQLAAAKTQAR